MKVNKDKALDWIGRMNVLLLNQENEKDREHTIEHINIIKSLLDENDRYQRTLYTIAYEATYETTEELRNMASKELEVN